MPGKGVIRLDDDLDESQGPLLDPRKAAEGHVTAANVLAGFCLTAIVLISGDTRLRDGAFDRAVGALLTAFLCLVLAGFLEALLRAQMRRSRRTFWVALLSSVTIATSSLFALWGLCEVIDVVFKRPGLNDLTGWVFVSGSVMIAAFIAHVATNVGRVMGYRFARAGAIVAQGAFVGLAVLIVTAVGIDEQSSIDRIAGLQLGGMAVVVIATLVLIARADAKRAHKPYPIGAIVTFVLAGIPAGVATALLVRLTSNPFG